MLKPNKPINNISMKILHILLMILISLGTLPAISNQYNVYSPNNFNDAIKQENQKERNIIYTRFI